MDIFRLKPGILVVLRRILGKIGSRGNPMWLPRACLEPVERAATRGRPYKNRFRGLTVAVTATAKQLNINHPHPFEMRLSPLGR